MLFKAAEYGLILLDLMLPGKSGGQVLEEIRKTSGVPVIALTAVSGAESVVSLLKAGADDYITKPFDNDVLLARIDVQLRNNKRSSGGLTFRDIVLDTELYDAFIGGQPLKLSKREFDILKLLMRNPKKVFSKNNLYESVWQEEFLGDDNTVNVHISKIRSKIAKFRPDGEYISTVWGIGFKMKEE
jgi:DNA-binding response OmpR family regulator